MQEVNSAPIHTETEFCAHYPSLSGVFDEMCYGANQIRPHWEYLMRSLKTLGRTELERRWQEARRLLRDNGVTYNVYDDTQGRDRPWQLDPIPLLISSENWNGIEPGLIQRAELMNLLLADLYGARETLRKGLLPIELVVAHPGFLRACVGIPMPNRRHRLPLYAVDLVRDKNGEVFVIADRTQTPSGAGYALENRMVLSRILPSLFRDSHVHRLSLFFRTLRITLNGMTKREEPRIVILTPGPLNETYFEHAYLAKYLGYTLVQGADLMVRGAQVCLKTLDGLHPVDVILRRVDDSFCDPLELRPDSYLGVAGLLQTLRMGNVAIANPLGSGILENPGLLPFLPALAKHFLGEELQIASPNTWWCGHRQARDYVLANMDKLVIKQIAYATPGGQKSVRGSSLSSKQREQLRAQIRARPQWFVGSEEVARSTTPVFVNGNLEPRPLVLRSFLVSSEDSYVVMPGGLTRVASSLESLAVSTQSGGISKDTWVLASEPEKQLTLVPDLKKPTIITEGHGGLPSRVAENLFWLGRYAERAEGSIRLLRTVFLYLIEPLDFTNQPNRTCLHNLLRAVTYLTETYPGFVGNGAEPKLAAPEAELLSVFLDKQRVGSLSATLQSLLNAATSVRDRLSPDMWRVISSINDELQALQRRTSLELSDALEELDNLITALAAFSGLSMESMTRGQGWRFLIIGRRLERAYHTIHLLRATLSTATSDDAALLEYLLTITDSLLTYRRRYRSTLQVGATLELILQNETNPRAIGFQLRHLEEYVTELPHEDSDTPYRVIEQRLILEALSQIRLANCDTLEQTSDGESRQELEQLLARLGRLLSTLSDAITHSYFSHSEQPRQLVHMGTD